MGSLGRNNLEVLTVCHYKVFDLRIIKLHYCISRNEIISYFFKPIIRPFLRYFISSFQGDPVGCAGCRGPIELQETGDPLFTHSQEATSATAAATSTTSPEESKEGGIACQTESKPYFLIKN